MDGGGTGKMGGVGGKVGTVGKSGTGGNLEGCGIRGGWFGGRRAVTCWFLSSTSELTGTKHHPYLPTSPTPVLN